MNNQNTISNRKYFYYISQIDVLYYILRGLHNDMNLPVSKNTSIEAMIDQATEFSSESLRVKEAAKTSIQILCKIIKLKRKINLEIEDTKSALNNILRLYIKMKV